MAMPIEAPAPVAPVAGVAGVAPVAPVAPALSLTYQPWIETNTPYLQNQDWKFGGLQNLYVKGEDSMMLQGDLETDLDYETCVATKGEHYRYLLELYGKRDKDCDSKKDSKKKYKYLQDLYIKGEDSMMLQGDLETDADYETCVAQKGHHYKYLLELHGKRDKDCDSKKSSKKYKYLMNEPWIETDTPYLQELYIKGEDKMMLDGELDYETCVATKGEHYRYLLELYGKRDKDCDSKHSKKDSKKYKYLQNQPWIVTNTPY